MKIIILICFEKLKEYNHDLAKQIKEGNASHGKLVIKDDRMCYTF